MKKTGFIILMFLVFSYAYSQETANQDISLAVRNSLLQWLEKIPSGDETNYGFQNREEFSQATLGTPIQVFDMGIDPSGQSGKVKYMEPAGEWRIPVIVDQKNRAVATVIKQNNVWEIVDFGASGLARELNDVKSHLTAEQFRKIKLFRTYQPLSNFLFYDDPASNPDLIVFLPLLSASDYFDSQGLQTTKTFTRDKAVNSQVLEVEKIEQKQSQWCWAGVSACVLNYYKKDQPQCAIVEYARLKDPVTFGNTDCCLTPTGKCNNPNGIYGGAGTISDILLYFGSIKNRGQNTSMSKTTITNEITNNRPFIIRWGWKSTDLENGHFMVGHGLVNETLYYMDPAKGEGFKFGNYNWVVEDDRHKWTHSLVLETSAGLSESFSTIQQRFYPNPASGKISFRGVQNSQKAMIEISNSNGSICYINPFPESGELDLSALPKGLYILRIITNAQSITTKLILQ
ncbi:MAG: T9SS type A sorting domain-containing protein [Bacteroidota bacterium]